MLVVGGFVFGGSIGLLVAGGELSFGFCVVCGGTDTAEVGSADDVGSVDSTVSVVVRSSATDSLGASDAVSLTAADGSLSVKTGLSSVQAAKSVIMRVIKSKSANFFIAVSSIWFLQYHYTREQSDNQSYKC